MCLQYLLVCFECSPLHELLMHISFCLLLLCCHKTNSCMFTAHICDLCCLQTGVCSCYWSSWSQWSTSLQDAWYLGRHFAARLREKSSTLWLKQPSNLSDKSRMSQTGVWVSVCVPVAVLCSTAERQSTGGSPRGWHHQSGRVSASSVSGLGCSSSLLHPRRFCTVLNIVTLLLIITPVSVNCYSKNCRLLGLCEQTPRRNTVAFFIKWHFLSFSKDDCMISAHIYTQYAQSVKQNKPSTSKKRVENNKAFLPETFSLAWCLAVCSGRRIALCAGNKERHN